MNEMNKIKKKINEWFTVSRIDENTYYPSTDPVAYFESVKRIAQLSVQRVLPGHHELEIPVSMLKDVSIAFEKLKKAGNLCHGAGVTKYGDFSIHL